MNEWESASRNKKIPRQPLPEFCATEPGNNDRETGKAMKKRGSAIAPRRRTDNVAGVATVMIIAGMATAALADVPAQPTVPDKSRIALGGAKTTGPIAAVKSGIGRFERRKRARTPGAVSVPADVLHALSDKATRSQRKVAFIRSTLPLVVKVNDKIMRDRMRIQRLAAYNSAGLSIDPKDAIWLSDISERYGVEKIDFGALLDRVDIVPPSLAVAQAAEETGWGTSRFARQGNALFGQKIFRDGDGIVPHDRPAGEVYRVRSFGSVMGAVRAYLHNLNTHFAYADFRRLRAKMRASKRPLNGFGLTGALIEYSERREAYLHSIRSIMRFNGLEVLDRLQPGAPNT